MSLLSDSNWRVFTDLHYKCSAINHYAKEAFLFAEKLVSDTNTVKCTLLSRQVLFPTGCLLQWKGSTATFSFPFSTVPMLKAVGGILNCCSRIRLQTIVLKSMKKYAQLYFLNRGSSRTRTHTPRLRWPNSFQDYPLKPIWVYFQCTWIRSWTGTSFGHCSLSAAGLPISPFRQI